MTAQKTKSLTLPVDTVSRMREMHILDTLLATPVSSKAPEDSNAAALQHGNDETQQPSSVETPPQRSAQAQERDDAETREPASARAQQRRNEETLQHKNAATKKRGNDTSLTETDNPVREAMRQALRQPYSADLSKGPSTATTIRNPTEIWERLDMASTLEGQTKQDIITEALKQYLKKIGRGEA